MVCWTGNSCDDVGTVACGSFATSRAHHVFTSMVALQDARHFSQVSLWRSSGPKESLKLVVYILHSSQPVGHLTSRESLL